MFRPIALLAVLLVFAGGSCASQEGAPQTPESPAPTLVADLTRATMWRSHLYAPSGTAIARLKGDDSWVPFAEMPGRVQILAAGPESLAAGGEGFLWIQPGKRKIAPLLVEEPGSWVALKPHGANWVALSQEGALLELSETGVLTRSRLEPNFRPNDLCEAWNQWWVVGQKNGRSHVVTATNPSGPWTEAPTGGKAPAMRILGLNGLLVVFNADGTAFRAVEGEGWEPSRGYSSLTAGPPTTAFASLEEGFIVLTPDGLFQSQDGQDWIRIAHQDDPYGTRALLRGEFGTLLVSQTWTEKGLSLRREPVTPFATFMLAQAFANGDGGVPLDPAKALELYRRAAIAGVRRAQVDLAFIIASGQAPGAPMSEASAWYLLLCGEEGEACAPEEAFKRIEALALQGRWEAQGILAVLLRLGFGTRSDSVAATAWTLIAEEHRSNVYALEWYADPGDNPEDARAIAASLRKSIARQSSGAATAPVSGTAD